MNHWAMFALGAVVGFTIAAVWIGGKYAEAIDEIMTLSVQLCRLEADEMTREVMEE